MNYEWSLAHGGVAVTARTIAVGLVDGQPHADALGLILGGEPGLEVSWIAETLEDAARRMAQVPTDVVIVNLRLPDGVGLRLLARGVSASPAFIVMSIFDRPVYARRARAVGAADFISKVAPGHEVVAAIRRAAAGAGPTTAPPSDPPRSGDA